MRFKYTLFLMFIALSSSATADENLVRVKQQHPEAYAESLAECEAWAESGQVDESERAEYINNCMQDLVGYLGEAFDEYDDSTDEAQASDELYE